MISALLCWLVGCTHPAPPTPASAASPRGMNAIYLIMVDRFANGTTRNDQDANPADPAAFHGGDLSGIRRHLDHVRGLGFDTIWITPVTQMRTEPIGDHGAFHGYWVRDGGAVDPRFGNEDDLVDLRHDMDGLGMNLLLDLVLNHTEPDSALLRTHPDWFHHNGDITDWTHTEQLRTHDVHGLPDLAQERSDVAEHLTRQGLGWIERVRPAGFRLDAVRHVDPEFLARYTASMREEGGAEFALLGEIFDGNPVEVARLARTTGLSHVFDFPLHHALIEGLCGGSDLRRIATVLTQDRRYDDPHRLVTFLDNHDRPRLWSACDGDRQRVHDALTLLLSLRGIPAITWGTEAELAGIEEVEARGDMRFEPTPTTRVIRDRIAQRRASSALFGGDTALLAAESDHLAMARVSASEVVVISVGSSTDRPTLPDIAGPASWMDLPGGEGRVHRWTLTPDSPDGFAPWVDTLRGQRADTVPVRFVVESVPEDQTLWLVGSDPAIGAWDPDDAVGPLLAGEATVVHLPAGGVVAHKLVARAEDGTTIWSEEPDAYLRVPPPGGEETTAVVAF